MDAARVIADLRELARRTGGPDGARRVCWTEEWRVGRGLLEERLSRLPVEVERDAAGNLWALLAGESEEIVAVGSHTDSVPGGGWLDGALGVFAGVEVLREFAARGVPSRSIALVDWADEEGSRFGRSVLGSSAFAGTLDPSSVRALRDADGVSLADAVAVDGLDVDAMARAGEGRRDRLAAYLELHIEQGPVLESEALACGAVTGTFGVERFRVAVEGRAGHAGSTPMDRRHDAGVAAARLAVGLQEIAREHGGVCTAGRIDLEPGIVTAVAGRAEVLVDQRHLDPVVLHAMRDAAGELVVSASEREGCTASVDPIWSIAPAPFDERLVAAAAEACRVEIGEGRTLPSGALHDASELAAVCPAAMVFSPSIGGVSHAADEDTREADLTRAIGAFGRLVEGVVSGGVG